MQTKSSSSSGLDLLLSRFSTDDVQEPAPQNEEMELILATALRAPDHGKLRPWRYIIVEGDERASFAQEVVASLERCSPDTSEEKKKKILRRFSSAPALVILGMSLKPDHKIPESEQIMSVAAGAMNVLNALYAEGFGGVWVSGAYCEEPGLIHKLGLSETGKLAGILMVGTPCDAEKKVKRPDVKGYMAYWHKGETPSFGADKGVK